MVKLAPVLCAISALPKRPKMKNLYRAPMLEWVRPPATEDFRRAIGPGAAGADPANVKRWVSDTLTPCWRSFYATWREEWLLQKLSGHCSVERPTPQFAQTTHSGFTGLPAVTRAAHVRGLGVSRDSPVDLLGHCRQRTLSLLNIKESHSISGLVQNKIPCRRFMASSALNLRPSRPTVENALRPIPASRSRCRLVTTPATLTSLIEASNGEVYTSATGKPFSQASSRRRCRWGCLDVTKLLVDDVHSSGGSRSGGPAGDNGQAPRRSDSRESTVREGVEGPIL